MSGHLTASDSSREICDAVLAQLNEFVPDIARAEKAKPCAFYHIKHNRFAYVYHSKGSVLVFFRGNHDDEASIFPQHLGINKREKMGGNWSKEFPFSMTLRNTQNVANISRLLIDYAYPLAHRKRESHGSFIRSAVTLPEEILPSATYNEGSVHRIFVNRYERDPKAREACIARYGTVCCICGFDFVTVFGEMMAGFIHVHHLTQLSRIGTNYEVDPVEDLRPVCPNCHAVIHRREPPSSIEEVQQFLSENKRR